MNKIADTFTQEASAAADQGNAEGAKILLERALENLSPRVTPPSQDVAARECLTETLWELARVVRILNRGTEADAIDARRAAIWKGRPADELINLTLKKLEWATQVGYGKIPASGPAKTIRDLDLDQAASTLSLAVHEGWTDLPKLKAHRDSDVLLARENVKSLIKPLESPDRSAQNQPKK
jgi:hypothetical protein